MICKPCGDAADILKALKGLNAIQRQPIFKMQALLLHQICKGGTWCDCRHHA